MRKSRIPKIFLGLLHCLISLISVNIFNSVFRFLFRIAIVLQLIDQTRIGKRHK